MSFVRGAEEQSQKNERKRGEGGRRGEGEERKKGLEFGPYSLETHTRHRMKIEILGIFSHSKNLNNLKL